MRKFYKISLIFFILINLFFYKEISCFIYDVVGEGGEFIILLYWLSIIYLPAIEWKEDKN